MKVTKYMVAWHQKNATGAPESSMGVAGPYDTRAEAENWIEDTVAEDRGRADERATEERDPSYMLRVDVNEGQTGCAYVTEGNGETCYYSVEEVTLDDKAAECIGKVEDILKDFKRNPKTKRDELQVIKRALDLIEKSRNDWMPMREWDVDIRFCPAGCVHHVMARTAEEAEAKVDEMLDKQGISIFTDEQKVEMMDSLLENIESVEAVGPRED